MDPLEEQAFGPQVAGSTGTGTDGFGVYMLPMTLLLFLVTVLSYTMCKCLEYHDLFSNNARCRNALLMVNAVVVTILVGAICRSVHEEATRVKPDR